MKLLPVLFFIIACFSICNVAYPQSVAINADGSLPNPTAMLDIKSSAKGILLPRTSTASRLAISNPAKGLILYDTTASAFYFYSSSAWTQLSAGSSGWNLAGNTATNPLNNFIGTTDDQPLRFRINNSWAGELHPTSLNVFLGIAAGQSNTNGQANTAIGDHSLGSNTDGTFNTAIGNNSLGVNTTGYNNTSIGSYSLSSNSTGFANTAVGRNSLFANTTGNFNTAAGADALLANITGNRNTASGYRALHSNINGDNNSACGYFALYANTIGNFNTATGTDALSANINGGNNVAVSSLALKFNTAGSTNTAVGSGTLYSNTTGNENTATGFQSLLNNTTGSRNTANGEGALYGNTTGWWNTATGHGALSVSSTGYSNTANGDNALYSNSTGNSNTAVGSLGLYSNTTGSGNTAVGLNALANNTGGYNNIAIGISSGIHPATPNIFNTVSIGNDGLLNAYQNQVFLGNNSTGFIGGKVNWSVISDARIKNTIQEDVKGLDFIMKLRTVTYHISNKAMTQVTGNKETPDFPGKYDGEKIKYTGFIAQEVEQAAKAIGYDFSGYEAPKNAWGLYTIRYAEFVVPLVKAMQEQQIIIINQQKQIDLLEKRLAALETKQ